MTPLQRRATLAYRSNDNSRLIRNHQGILDGWVDVLGTGHPLPVDPKHLSPETRAQLRDDDCQVVYGARIIDPERFVACLEPEPKLDVAWLLIGTAGLVAVCILIVAYLVNRDIEALEPITIETAPVYRPYAEFEIDSQGRLVHP